MEFLAFWKPSAKLADSLNGASIADKIVGKAIALLCVYARVKAVYAVILSKQAKSVLEQHSIYHKWENLTENIVGINKTACCPFEKLATKISNPKDAYLKLKALQNSLRNSGRKLMSSEHEHFISGEDEELKRKREETKGTCGKEGDKTGNENRTCSCNRCEF